MVKQLIKSIIAVIFVILCCVRVESSTNEIDLPTKELPLSTSEVVQFLEAENALAQRISAYIGGKCGSENLGEISRLINDASKFTDWRHLIDALLLCFKSSNPFDEKFGNIILEDRRYYNYVKNDNDTFTVLRTGIEGDVFLVHMLTRSITPTQGNFFIEKVTSTDQVIIVSFNDPKDFRSKGIFSKYCMPFSREGNIYSSPKKDSSPNINASDSNGASVILGTLILPYQGDSPVSTKYQTLHHIIRLDENSFEDFDAVIGNDMASEIKWWGWNVCLRASERVPQDVSNLLALIKGQENFLKGMKSQINILNATGSELLIPAYILQKIDNLWKKIDILREIKACLPKCVVGFEELPDGICKKWLPLQQQ